MSDDRRAGDLVCRLGAEEFAVLLYPTTAEEAFKVAERHSFEFRSEFFNSLNHVQYSTPGTAFGTASFGVIGSTSVAARLIQLGLKYNF